MTTLFDGYIDRPRGDWPNHIIGPGAGIPLADATDLKLIHVGHHRCGEKGFVSHDYELVKPSPLMVTNCGYAKINFVARLMIAIGADRAWQIIAGRSSKPLSSHLRKQYQLWSATLDAKLISPLFPGKLKLQAGYHRVLPLIQTAYRDSNAKLATLLNTNLEHLGSPVSDSSEQNGVQFLTNKNEFHTK